MEGDVTEDRWCLNMLHMALLRAGECAEVNSAVRLLMSSFCCDIEANWSIAVTCRTSLDMLHHLNGTGRVSLNTHSYRPSDRRVFVKNRQLCCSTLSHQTNHRKSLKETQIKQKNHNLTVLEVLEKHNIRKDSLK